MSVFFYYARIGPILYYIRVNARDVEATVLYKYLPSKSTGRKLSLFQFWSHF